MHVSELVAPVVLSSRETLEDAILAQARAAAHIAAVTDDGNLAGIATAEGILAAYRAARSARSPATKTSRARLGAAPGDPLRATPETSHPGTRVE